MAYVNDAQTLADVVGGGAAAAQMGIQNDAANAEQQLKQQTLQGQQAAEIAKPGLQNLFTQAQTANENAVAQQNQTQALVGQATAPSSIGAKNAGNQAAMTADQAKSLSTFGGIAGQVAGMMDNVPQAARPAAMAQIAQHYGMDLSTLPQELQNGDPDVLRQVSQKAVQASASYQEQVLKGSQDYSKAVDTSHILADSRTDVAQTNAGAKQYAADRAAQVKVQLQKVDNVVAQLMQKQAAGTLSPQEATTLNQAREAQAVAKSNPYVNALLNPDAAGGSNGAPIAQPGNGGGGGGGAPQAVPKTPALQAAAAQKFGDYDESKYNYVQAINPKTGQMDIGRIAK